VEYTLNRLRFPLLTSLGRNLTELAGLGTLDPVFGRDRELDRMLDILLRRRAHNPLLVGPPGVGKTALVEALAQRLFESKNVPRSLAGCLVIEVTAGAMLSGTGMRGALSERMRRVAAEIAQCDRRVLLFFDEVHGLLGGQEGQEEFCSELKAQLNRSEVQCIGSTTELEFRKRMERDTALARRFTRIDVEEPSIDVAARIIEGLSSRYEEYHQVSYRTDALTAAVTLSSRFLPEQHLPDKAISVVDTAGARVARLRRRQVRVQDVAEVVAHHAAVSVERLLMSDASRLLSLETELNERVVGQQNAIGRIARALRKAAVGFRGTRPLGSFLLLGSTGVGKTETAKVINEVLFPGSTLFRIDMSELSEAHAVSRLLGAPPGYIGHEDGGQLTEAVRHRPYRLILLDEIEKAHRDVLLALLPLLDEGKLTDSRGRIVDFQNTLILMTSNLGTRTTPQTSSIGFGEIPIAERNEDEERSILQTARAALPPEFWNRIDEPLYFRRLSADDVKMIARRMIAEVARTLSRERGVVLEAHDEGVAALLKCGGFDELLGARPMRRAIARWVEGPLAEAVLSDQLRHGESVLIEGDDNGVSLRIRSPKQRKSRVLPQPQLTL